MSLPPSQRADARRNRERILAVALEELSRDPQVPLSVLARRAGVGQATMYRNFPDRDALILAAYDREVTQLVASASILLAERSPDAALRAWISGLARFARSKSGLSEAIQQASRAAGGPPHPGLVRIRSAVDELLDANRRAGLIREDITADDVMLLIAGIWDMPPGADGEDRASRLIDLAMRALRSDGAHES